jgi:hypothetical protein
MMLVEELTVMIVTVQEIYFVHRVVSHLRQILVQDLQMQLMSEYQEVLRVLYDHRTILHTMTMRSVSGSFLVIQQILL